MMRQAVPVQVGTSPLMEAKKDTHFGSLIK